MRDKRGLKKAQLKDKVKKTVTRKAAISSAPVDDDNRAQSQMRYNLRKRKGQEEKDHCPANKKHRPNIQAQNDEQKTVTNSRILITRSKMTVLKEQTNKTTQHKTTHSLKRKNHSPVTTSANSSKKAKPPPKLNKKSQKSTSVWTGKASSSVKKNAKSSSKLRTAKKGKEYISPRLKQSLGNRNPSTLKKRRIRSAQVKQPVSEKELQSKTPLKRKRRGCNELSGKFADMFLNKLDLVAHIDIGNRSPIHGISVTHDNLVWVNSLSKRVNLYNSSGDLLRFFDLDYHPVFNCCMPNGDLLVTTGFSTGAKPTLEYISREGDTRLLADLSEYADLLCGILYQDERIYVIGDRYIILKVDMNGEVEKDFEIESDLVDVNHLISQNGRIFALNNNIFSMYLLGSDKISTNVINKVAVDNSYSASASVDNFGNIIVGVDPPASKIVVIDPRLERKYEIGCDFSGMIRATAVDKQNQVWIGTDDGNLYIAKYLK
ncbi:uncharacterized protein LOC128183486 isoform X1 [Crassostrea angulata]|uniref:uncharacterized protein LOC128183486 isoform X1 n=2 Tax=Magallana angulata TaxID=2784310 RepID=UPI0022B20EF3|nr:uncharacterized protein LOC128183486 isoform X1 [Crassostrea angulata]XP_052708469.1 uncharacterized protein LOC128183486 isoform X1 [Crassostrea angulata]XP_052708478.1 uncharacterized protein LOC128183486 isoform X1 [Crassostrea angulata]